MIHKNCVECTKHSTQFLYLQPPIRGAHPYTLKNFCLSLDGT